MSEAKVEQKPTETLSFRCYCERCRLMRGRIGQFINFKRIFMSENLKKLTGKNKNDYEQVAKMMIDTADVELCRK